MGEDKTCTRTQQHTAFPTCTYHVRHGSCGVGWGCLKECEMANHPNCKQEEQAEAETREDANGPDGETL